MELTDDELKIIHRALANWDGWDNRTNSSASVEEMIFCHEVKQRVMENLARVKDPYNLSFVRSGN